jgi:hypothetical protein
MQIILQDDDYNENNHTLTIDSLDDEKYNVHFSLSKFIFSCNEVKTEDVMSTITRVMGGECVDLQFEILRDKYFFVKL